MGTDTFDRIVFCSWWGRLLARKRVSLRGLPESGGFLSPASVAVEEGRSSARRGELLEHDEVVERIDKLLRS